MRQLDEIPLGDDHIGLLKGLTTTRAIRRYTNEPIPEKTLRDMLFAATRAPSGSNRQNFRFIVLTTGEIADNAREIIGEAARKIWESKRSNEGYESGSGTDPKSPKARMARSMNCYVENMERVPALVFPILIRHRPQTPSEGASVYPACQNLLLAARALGFGGVLTIFNALVEDELRDLLALPDEAVIAATITLGRPAGNHGPVRRLPLDKLVFQDRWGEPALWAIDPPETQHTSAGPMQSA